MKVDRLVSIIMILLEKKRIGAQELADMFEVSPRTIYRDIDAINLSGVPICAIPGVGGGFEIMENYKVDKKVFSSDDLSAILMGLSSLSNMMQGNELANALAKVKSFIPAEQAKDIEIKTNQILIDLSTWMGNENIQPYMKIIKAALQENKLLSFAYVGHHGNKSSRIIEPYQLVLKSTQWYCQGYCRMRNDFRLFKLSRMSDLQIVDEIFSPREYEKPQLEFNDALSTIQTTVKIRIHQSIMDMVLDYCSYDHFSQDMDDYFIVDFPFVENDYYYNILLSFGSKCEVVEPLPVREEMKRKIQEINTVYSQLIYN